MRLLALPNSNVRFFCTALKRDALTNAQKNEEFLTILGQQYKRDHVTNISEKMSLLIERKLHRTRHNPLNLLCLRVKDHFQQNYKNRNSSPLYAYLDNLSPVVTKWQNFDSLRVPEDHASRRSNETYYVNSDHLLRAHTSAHQVELVSSGLDNFLMVGDVYRRDEIDRTHFPCFHQMEGVSLFTEEELFSTGNTAKNSLKLHENGQRTPQKQEFHTFDCSHILQQRLKNVLEGLMRSLFGQDLECRWIDAFFPFTHPSFELEIFHNGKWVEILGCGIMQQEILRRAGAGYKVGFAFGLGLERLAMKLYSIPDIRLFWSQDSAFLSQFHTEDHNRSIVYKPISKFPKLKNDISMWLPENYEKANFYDIVRSVGGDTIEHIEMVDEYRNEITGKHSHCYRITYRHMERRLSQEEVTSVHRSIGENAEKILGVSVRQ